MVNRISEFSEDAPKPEHPYKAVIAQTALPYIGGLAYTQIKMTGTESFSQANRHTFLRYEFSTDESGFACVSFFYENKESRQIVCQKGPIDRCVVRRLGTTSDSSLSIAFAQSGEEWYVDPPLLGSLGGMLGPAVSN